MIDPQEENSRSGHEDEISADRAHPDRKNHADDESYKTSPRKHRLGWERPQDEQMFETFNDRREQGTADA
ncbi:hypothetical protein [Hufsiella ginkgonis]|uniref:Uncharacterized protein n=1 Tax=Hufsiella ginkgonis TaxID=2695274 RepID=A0A7K1XSU6_9SPHI|nr:hypothetical protein [Hufsiella ginkgonis]MXV13829.1 hypothetical protein [Hufsiella ginkgonis]